MKNSDSRFQNIRLMLVIVFSLCFTGINAIVKTSASNGNWSNSSSWTPSGVPLPGDKIFIYHTITLDQNFSSTDTIFVYNVLSLKSNKVLTLNQGMMILVNNSQYNGRIGTMEQGSNISGNFVFQKWVTRCDGFSTYGSPFDVNVSDFDWYYCYRCMPSWSNIYFYDETKPGSLENGYYDSIPGKIKRGLGFYYWYSNYSGGQNFPRQISLKGSTNFKSDFEFPVTKTTSSVSTDDGYNLVSNPFPGTIDWSSESGWDKRKINDAIYTWNSCSGLYSSYVSGVGVNGGSRYISSMQGFWVQANHNNPLLRINTEALVNGSQSLQKSSESSQKVLRLSLQDDEIALVMDNTGSSGLDSLKDALKFLSENSRICSSYDSFDFSINSIPSDDQVIPLKVKGGGILHITGVNKFNDYVLYLRDLSTGLTKQMIGDFDYLFNDTSTVGFNTRFEIHFRKNKVTGIEEQKNVSVTIKSGTELVTIVPQGFQYPLQVSVCDLLGRQLLNQSFEQGELNLPKWNEPVIIRISDKSSSLVKKVF